MLSEFLRKERKLFVYIDEYRRKIYLFFKIFIDVFISCNIDFYNFNSIISLRMLIHGFGQTGQSDFNKQIKDGLLKHEDYNVIVVDWSTASGKSYNDARKKLLAIGKSVAQFIDWMKLDKGYLHVIGFDLGEFETV
jgi:pimeloyl-ACP methyl ester carboxylesterase